MSRAPLVSVLLPVRDAAGTLDAALRSVARQRLTDLECVVVDDGSRDASPAIAARFARDDPRFRVLRRPARGLVAALNAGLVHGRAAYVARMDADDLMHRERLALQVAALDAAPALAGVGCHVRVFPRRGLRDGLRRYERWLRGIDSPQRVRREAFVECPLPHPTWMLRREALAAVGGWRDAGWAEDYDLLLRLLGTGRELGVVPRRLHAWRDHPDRLWRRGPAYAEARFRDCKAHFLARGPLRGGERYLLWGHGDTGRALRRALAAEGRRPAYVIELHPGRLGQRIHGAPVVRPECIPALPRLPLVASVAGDVARREIRSLLARCGWREGVDWVCAA